MMRANRLSPLFIAVMFAFVGVSAAAGAAPSADREAITGAKQILRAGFSDEGDLQYDLLLPAQRRQVDRSLFNRCASTNDAPSIAGISLVKTSHVRFRVPGVRKPMDATAVALAISFNTGTNTNHPDRLVVHQFRDGRRWYGALRAGQLAAYKAGTCPLRELAI
jgi:hypothetical protein